MLKDILAETVSIRLTVIRCKACDKIVQKGIIHHCHKSNNEIKVRLGANAPDNFYIDKGIERS